MMRVNDSHQQHVVSHGCDERVEPFRHGAIVHIQHQDGEESRLPRKSQTSSVFSPLPGDDVIFKCSLLLM